MPTSAAFQVASFQCLLLFVGMFLADTPVSRMCIVISIQTPTTQPACALVASSQCLQPFVGTLLACVVLGEEPSG